jgi:hypothetical protein
VVGDVLRAPGLSVQRRSAKRMAARLEGVLVVDEGANCLVVDKGGRHIDVAWPPGFSADARDGSVVLGGGYVAPSAAHANSCTGSERVFAAWSLDAL